MKEYIGTKIIAAEPHKNEKGLEGYKVVYADGYESWSPSGAFKDAYRANGNMSFGHAIVHLKMGHAVSRSGWNGKGMWLMLQVPDEHSKMTLPYIYMYTAQNHQVPWLASQTDMLADDWGVVSIR